MTQYIDKDALVAEIERLIERAKAERVLHPKTILAAKNYLLIDDYNKLISFLDTLEVKDVDEKKERISECPFRQVVCTMYIDKALKCSGVCSWVVDCPRLKELKTPKGE